MKPPADDRIAEMFRAHGQAMLLYARQWVNAAEAEDVVQRVFVRLLVGGRLPAEPRTWLYRCVRNEAISVCRSGRRRDRRERSAVEEVTACFVSRPEDRIDARAAQDAMHVLPPLQREVVTLRIWSGLTLAEIAQITGVAVSSVHHQYRAALAAMRQKLESPCRNQNP
jgi:RNA polymerase sigma-70 factor (ECF subfamily)